MIFYLNVLKTRLKLTINKFFIMAVFLYAIFIVVTIFNFGDDEQNVAKVGFVHEDNDFTKDLINQFNYYGKDFFISVEYESKEDLQKSVATNKIDCGYVLPNEYINRKNSIQYISSDKTILGEYSNLLISSIYLQNNADNLGYNAIRKILDEDSTTIKEKINEKNANYLEKAPFMSYTYEGVNGKEIIQSNNIYIILYGITGLFLTLFCLLFYLNEAFENNIAIYLALQNKRNKIKYYLGNLTSYNIILFIFSILSISIMKFIFMNEVITFYDALVIQIFCFMLSSLVFTLTLIKNYNAMSLFIIFYFITACILGDVFIHIGVIIPMLSFTKYLYPTYYFKESVLNENTLIIVCMLFISFLTNAFNFHIVRNNKYYN